MSKTCSKIPCCLDKYLEVFSYGSKVNENTISACFCSTTGITADHVYSLMFINIKNKDTHTIITHPAYHATEWFDVFAQLADLFPVGLIFLQVAGTRGGYCRTRSVQ